VGLHLGHLHLSDREPWIEVAWQTSKGQKGREVGLGADTARALGRYLRLGRPALASRQETTLWLNRFGQPITRSGLDQALYELRDHAGRERFQGVRVSAHTFRHSFALAFLKATGDVYRLSRLLGHSSVSVTEHYLRSFRARDARGESAWVSPADILLRRA
jgi:site-specific recombinase XerD